MSKHKFDATKDAVNVTWKTLQDLFDNGTPDAIALYMRYCYIAQLKGNTIVDANNIYMMNGSKLAQHRFTKAKKILIDLGYIKNEYFGDGVWRVVVNHLVTNSKMKTNSTLSDADKIEPISTLSVSMGIEIANNTERYKLIQKDKEEEEEKFFSHSNVIPTTTDAPHANVPIENATATATVGKEPNDVKHIINAFQKATGIKETVFENTKKVIGQMINEFGVNRVISDLSKTDHWTNPKTRRLNKIFKSRSTYINKAQSYSPDKGKEPIIQEIRTNGYVPETEKETLIQKLLKDSQ